MWQLAVPPLELVARTALVYALFIAVLRLTGKRQLGQVTLFDLAALVLAANALQPAVTGPDNSITGGVIIVVTIFALNRVVAEAREHVQLFRTVLQFEPSVLARDGAWVPGALSRQGLDDEDAAAALREHGLERIQQAKLVTLEEDGTVSVIGADETATGADGPVCSLHGRNRRRRRAIRCRPMR
jgi:uncharacterized membrane protein YcaP (DUF421 family)